VAQWPSIAGSARFRGAPWCTPVARRPVRVLPDTLRGRCTPCAKRTKARLEFPMAYNESMTLDASTLQGIRCTCRMVRFPQPIFCKGWETLFYNRERNLAVGRTLRGAASASTRWAARHRTRPRTQLSAIRRCRKRPPLSATEWIVVGIPDRGRRMTAAAELSRSQHIGKR
jgi:hypothetical protein